MTLNSTKIRILHIITGLSTGGAEMMLLKLLSATQDGCEQAVVSLQDEGTLGPRIKELGVPVHAMALRPAVPNPLRTFYLRSVVREFRPDLIQGWMYHGNLTASLASMFWRRHIPVLWGIHQSIRETADYGYRTGAVIRLGAWFSHHPEKIVYVSRTGARQHEAIGYVAKKEIIIPNGIDCQAFRPNDEARQSVRAELGISSESVVVGLIARYHPMKDHLGFLMAAAEVARVDPSVCFVLVGRGVSGEQPALRKLIDEHRLQDRVLLLGERHDTARLTAAFDIGCSASAWGEAFSIAIGEAMACGIPCVVTDVGDSASIVGETGVSVPPRDHAALASAICQLIDAGSQRRRELGAAARKRVESEFSLSTVACRYETLYHELLPGQVPTERTT